MENDNLKKLQHFMLVNKRIKNELYNMCPPFEGSGYTTDTIIKYSDNVYASLKYIFSELEKVALNFNNELFLSKIKELKKRIISNFILCKLNLVRYRDFYKNNISDMNEELVNIVKKECVGYSIDRLPYNSLKKVKTINELLHVIHSYILNNESIYKSMNKLAEKENIEGYPITLYGVNDSFSVKLFNFFPIYLNCGWVDIVSLGNNHIIMMIRDRGHALTIEIEKVKDDIMVSYFIPKLCNIEMINKLPGVNKVREDADIFSGTRGSFIANDEDIYLKLFTFISMVPMDHDMDFKQNNGMLR